jgi:hypothetical protein
MLLADVLQVNGNFAFGVALLSTTGALNLDAFGLGCYV